MKKILIFMLMAIPLLMVSCKDVTPEFKFQVDVSGDVADSATAVVADFNAHVANETAVLFSAYDDAVILQTAPEAQNAVQWLDKYVYDNYIKSLPNTTEYTIVVKGHVHETLTGLTIAVDRTFTNRTNSHNLMISQNDLSGVRSRWVTDYAYDPYITTPLTSATNF